MFIKYPVSNERRLTMDHYRVLEGDMVWEIMWERYNEETSQAYPYENLVENVPEQFPIWWIKDNCLKECRKLNKAKTNPLKQ